MGSLGLRGASVCRPCRQRVQLQMDPRRLVPQEMASSPHTSLLSCTELCVALDWLRGLRGH